MGKSNAQRGSTSNNFNGRMSYAPGTSTPFGQQPQLSASQSLQRRSSIYSRPSTSAQALGQQSFFVQAPIAAGVPADKRRLKDRGVQTEMARQLEEYLNQNNFQMEMKHQLNPKSFLSPTQKDFNMMFQWLYKRIDPGYRFEKSIDAEVPPILKQLRYPFERSISKSQLMAVGGQNWWTFLGMLHWLMQLAQMMERFAEDRYDDALLQEDIDVTPDRISFRFLSRAYQTWLTCPPGEDEEEEEADKMLIPFVNEMAAEFDRSNAQYIEELKMLEAAHEALQNQIAEAEKSANELEKLHEVNKIVESDLKKFEEYGANIQQKLKKRETQNQMLKNDIESWEKQLNEAAKERSDLQEAVDRQGISIQDIDRMNGERVRLQQGVDAAKARLEELAQTIKDKETEASTKLAELENLVRQYNTLCYEVGIRDEEFELELNISDVSFGSSQMGTSQHGAGDRLLANGDSGYHPSSILNLDLRGKVKSYINSLRKEINSKRHAAKEQDEDNRRLLFELSGAIDDKKLEIEALDHRVRSAEEEFEKTKEVR
jgi:kinetochore protein NDC80